MLSRNSYIVSYRAKDALHIDTVYFGPFDTYQEACDCVFALPAVIDCEHKFIITLTPANYDANGKIETL